MPKNIKILLKHPLLCLSFTHTKKNTRAEFAYVQNFILRT